MRVGDYAHAGTTNVSVIDTDSYWIDVMGLLCFRIKSHQAIRVEKLKSGIFREDVNAFLRRVGFVQRSDSSERRRLGTCRSSALAARVLRVPKGCRRRVIAKRTACPSAVFRASPSRRLPVACARLASGRTSPSPAEEKTSPDQPSDLRERWVRLALPG
jgi:hypothetical protein